MQCDTIVLGVALLLNWTAGLVWMWRTTRRLPTAGARETLLVWLLIPNIWWAVVLGFLAAEYL